MNPLQQQDPAVWDAIEAEAIRQQLADDQDQAPEVTLRTFAPDHLVPGRTLLRRSRNAGPSLGRYRSMVGELFSS